MIRRRGGRCARAFAAVLCLAGASLAQQSSLRLPRPDDAAQEERIAPGERLGSADGARDESGDGRAYVEVASARDTAFVGETIAIEVRVGFEARFLDENVIPLFRRHLDVPAQVEAAWLDDEDSLALTRAFVEIAPDAAVTIARNDRLARARRLPDRSVNGREFRVVALDVRRIERAPGTLRLAAPRLVYARASAFTEDFVHGRVPTERVDAYVLGRDLEIEVVALPEEGRPLRFSGAVGTFHADGRLGTASSEESVRFVLSLHGDGDLADAAMPDASSFAGLRVLGVLDDKGRARRTVTYDLVPDGPGPRRVGPIEVHVFDPSPSGRYVTLATPPIDVAANASPEPAAFGSHPSNGVGTAHPGSALVLVGAAILALLALAAAVFVLRRRR